MLVLLFYFKCFVVDIVFLFRVFWKLRMRRKDALCLSYRGKGKRDKIEIKAIYQIAHK